METLIIILAVLSALFLKCIIVIFFLIQELFDDVKILESVQSERRLHWLESDVEMLEEYTKTLKKFMLVIDNKFNITEESNETNNEENINSILAWRKPSEDNKKYWENVLVIGWNREENKIIQGYLEYNHNKQLYEITNENWSATMPCDLFAEVIIEDLERIYNLPSHSITENNEEEF